MKLTISIQEAKEILAQRHSINVNEIEIPYPAPAIQIQTNYLDIISSAKKLEMLWVIMLSIKNADYFDKISMIKNVRTITGMGSQRL